MKKLLSVLFIMMLVWGLTGAIALAEESYPAAPAVAEELLDEADVDARYGERNEGGVIGQ